METRKIRIKIVQRGKAPTKFHRDAYKYFIGDAVFLSDASWVKVGHGRSYAYFIPPNGKEGSSLILEVKVPTDAEVRRLANKLHEEGSSKGGQLLGFNYRYYPAGVMRFRFHGDSPADAYERYHSQPKGSGISEHPEFAIGIGGPWGINLIWSKGSDTKPTWYRRGELGDDERSTV